MKRKYNIIKAFKPVAFACLAIWLITACEEDFLEKAASSDVTIDTVFSNTSNAQQVISELYNNQYFGSDNIPLNWWNDDGWLGWSDFSEDLYTTSASWHGRVWKYIDGTLNPSSTPLQKVSTTFYAIRTANIFKENAKTIPAVSEIDEEYIQQMLGEAYAHVGYQYFKAFRLWGSLPWIDKALEGGEDPYSRVAFSEMIDSIEVSLDKAADLLPDDWDDRWTGRFTRPAALALKAKVLVYAASPLYNGETSDFAAGYEYPEVLGYGNYDKERWKKAADACKIAIDACHAAGHELYDDAGTEHNIYELALNLTKEHLLYERWNEYNTLGGWSYCHNQMNYPYDVGWYMRAEAGMQPTLQHVDFYQLKNGKFPIEGYSDEDGTEPILSQAGIDAGYTDQNFANDRDPRFAQNLVYHGSTFGENYNDKIINFDADVTVPDRTRSTWTLFKTCFMVRKFVNEDLGEASTVTHGAIHPILRLADLYLLYAEALSNYYDGPNSEALQYFNAVRSRSGMPNYDSSSYAGDNAKEKFQNAIKYERRVEFYLEAQRYFDLRRWKDGEELAQSYAGFSINNGIISRVALSQTTVWKDRLYFHPFETDDVNNTPGLYQNPGY
jgi:hypothetical protein